MVTSVTCMFTADEFLELESLKYLEDHKKGKSDQPLRLMLPKPLRGPRAITDAKLQVTLTVEGQFLQAQSVGTAKAGCAVVSYSFIIEAATLPSSTTSQQAELIALTHALTLAKGLHVNICTDSQYAFHILHHHAAIWAERGFHTTQGSSIINAPFIKALLKVALLPAKARVIHCRGLRIQATPKEPTGYSPFELLYGCTFLLGSNLIPDTSPLGDYLPVLQQARHEIRQAANFLLPTSDTRPCENTLPGRSVLVKSLTPRSPQPQWTGTFLVLYSTPTAVHLQDPPQWVHHSRIKLCPSDNQPDSSACSWKSQVLSPASLKVTRIPKVKE
ncbi:uncharacterized protein LOC116557392 [Sapajus apella]|uniref:Uncharacterized protein LOC116557392 n=1 Tax=Sapajus apella TaxID=9515 RepID=A0A6J3IL58_SAPAP|nr:uncharacterized protein LOC116557392 [Sapajus apella]